MNPAVVAALDALFTAVAPLILKRVAAIADRADPGKTHALTQILDALAAAEQATAPPAAVPEVH